MAKNDYRAIQIEISYSETEWSNCDTFADKPFLGVCCQINTCIVVLVCVELSTISCMIAIMAISILVPLIGDKCKQYALDGHIKLGSVGVWQSYQLHLGF